MVSVSVHEGKKGKRQGMKEGREEWMDEEGRRKGSGRRKAVYVASVSA